MTVNRTLFILFVLAIFFEIVEVFVFALNAVFFSACFTVLLLLSMLKISIRRQMLIGSILVFVLGAWFIIWLNDTLNPTFVLIFGFPFLSPPLFLATAFWEAILLILVLPISLFVLLLYFLRGFKGSLFFLGASLASIVYAGWTLIQIAWLYYANVGWALPDINIEGYSFPAIYTFNLFRSIFFATFFTLLGHLNSIGILSKIVAEFSRLRKRKEKRLTDFESRHEEASVQEVLNLHNERGQTENLSMSGNRRTRRNKDADLLKIQILADYYQANFSFLGSIVSGSLIGLFIVAITLRLENVLSDISYYLLIGVIAGFFLFYGTRTYRSYHSDLEKIDNLFIRVQNGETLPSITELRKMKKVRSS